MLFQRSTLISFTSMILSRKEDFCVLVPKQCYEYNLFVCFSIHCYYARDRSRLMQWVHLSLLLIQWFKLERKRLPIGDAACGMLVTSVAVKYKCNDSEVIHLSCIIRLRYNGVVKVELFSLDL